MRKDILVFKPPGRKFYARFVAPSIAELRLWVRNARGTPSEIYARQALAARLRQN